MNTIESTSLSWTRSTLSHDQVIRWTKPKVGVYLDFALCLGKLRTQSDAITRWNGQVEESKMSASYGELLGIEGKAIEFEWNISQELRHCRFFRWSRVICKNGTLNLKNSQIGSSSGQSSTILVGQEKETMRFVFRIQKKSRHTRRNSRMDTGRSSVLEMKRSGVEKQSTFLKESEIQWRLRWCSDSRKQVTQSSRVPVHWAVEFWECWKEKKPYTSMRMLQTQNSCSNHPFSKPVQHFRSSFKTGEQIGSTEDEKGQEITLDKGESVNKEIVNNVISQEVNLWVSSLRLASGNSLRNNIQLSEPIQFTRVCEDASFWYRVSAGMSFMTKPDEDDGFGQIISLLREYTLFRSEPTILSICSNSWRDNCWTSHWSSRREISWQFWTWDRNFMSKQSKTQDGDLMFCYPEEGVDSWTNCISQMSNVTAPARSYSLIVQTQKKANFAWRSRWLAHGNLLRPLLQVSLAPGNWMRTFSAFLPACVVFVLFLNHSYDGKEVENYSCRGFSFSDLQNGRSIGASFWSRRTTIWCSSSLGHDKAETGRRLASTHPWRKQQDEVRVLRGFPKFLDLLSSFSRTLWWNVNCAWIDGAHCSSLQLEGVLCFTGVVLSAFSPSLRTDSLQEENKTGRDDRPSSSRLSTLSGKTPMKKYPETTLQFLRKCTITAIGNVIRMPFIA